MPIRQLSPIIVAFLIFVPMPIIVHSPIITLPPVAELGLSDENEQSVESWSSEALVFTIEHRWTWLLLATTALIPIYEPSLIRAFLQTIAE